MVKSPASHCESIVDLFKKKRQNRHDHAAALKSTHDNSADDDRGYQISSSNNNDACDNASNYHHKNANASNLTGKDLEAYRAKGDYTVKIQAPMVRYSRLPFRLLCKKYGCDVMYTHMIIADSFNNSQKARDVEFVTCKDDYPLVVQFASSSSIEFAKAAQHVARFCDAVDLNCGCPQRWAIQEGIGSALLRDPAKIADYVRQTNRIADGLPVAVKIRINKDLRKTVDLVQQVEAAGASWITVHGRTPQDKSSVRVDADAIKLMRESVAVPVVHNGDAFTLQNAYHFAMYSDVDGVMSARGLLQNPSLFAGYDYMPIECLTDFIHLATKYGMPFITFHHHCQFMLDPYLTKEERFEFIQLTSLSGVIDFFKTRGIVL